MGKQDEAFEKWWNTQWERNQPTGPLRKMAAQTGWDARGEHDAELLAAYRELFKLGELESIGTDVVSWNSLVEFQEQVVRARGKIAELEAGR